MELLQTLSLSQVGIYTNFGLKANALLTSPYSLWMVKKGEIKKGALSHQI